MCVNRDAAMYTVTMQTVAGPAGRQTEGVAACPTGVVVGGGVLSSSASLQVNVNSIIPFATTGWRADVNNASGERRGLHRVRDLP